MKKLLIITILLITLSMVGCVKELDKSIFIEPSGYVITYVHTGSFSSDYYGYIKNEDIEKYKNGQIKVIEMLYPYTDKKQYKFLIDLDIVKSMEFGTYQDVR